MKDNRVVFELEEELGMVDELDLGFDEVIDDDYEQELAEKLEEQANDGLELEDEEDAEVEGVEEVEDTEGAIYDLDKGQEVVEDTIGKETEDEAPEEGSVESEDDVAIVEIKSDMYERWYKSNIQVDSIIIGEQLKQSRVNTLQGLTQSIANLGVVVPISVLELSSGKYIVLDGVRRLYGAVAAGITEVPAIVWKFKDEIQGKKLALMLGLMINKSKSRTWYESYELVKALELQGITKPQTMEYLLNLSPGDFVKLTDIMTSSFPEPKDDLLNKKKDLQGAFKMLDKLRKGADIESMEDGVSLSSLTDEADGVDSGGKRRLDDDAVKDLLDLADNLDEEVVLSGDDFSEENKFEPNQQVVGHRERLDPQLRWKVLSNDDFKCVCCGTGGSAFMGTLAVHHIVPVHAGGKDEERNLKTLCVACHITLHECERRKGVLPITKEDYEKYDEHERLRIQKIIKLAKIAVEAGQKAGVSDTQAKELAKKGTRHTMPGEILKQNMDAMQSSGLPKKENDVIELEVESDD